MSASLTGVAGALAGGLEAFARAWIDRYEASELRLPGAIEHAALVVRVEPVLRALAETLGPAGDVPALVPGGAALREVEKELGFLGARLAAEGRVGFDAAALLVALRDTLLAAAGSDAERDTAGRLCDWLYALAFDAFAGSERAAARERARELLEERSPVLCIAPDVPIALPIGDDGAGGLEAVLARLVMQVVRVGARVAVIDAGGLVDPASHGALAALSRFFGHDHIAGKVAILATGLSARELAAWRRAGSGAGVEIIAYESFVDAVASAFARAGHQLVRRA